MEENNIVIDRPTIAKENKSKLTLKPTIISYSGPLPPASELKEYEKILPGIANRLLSLTESENNHRQKIETEALAANIKFANQKILERIFGQCFGYIITMSTIICGFILALKGKLITGTIFSGTGIAALAAVFYSSKIIKIFKNIQLYRKNIN